MTVNLFTTDIRLENDVVLARQKARAIAAALKFDAQDQTRIATAVSEIARNTFQYGGGGTAEFRIDDQPEKMLVITLRDKGKGISNLDEIFDGKYVSEIGMGVGIIGARRLMDYFHIDSSSDRGTTVVLGKRVPRRFSRLEAGDLNKLLSNIERASQDPYEELKQQNKELLGALDELRKRQEELAQLNRELDETNRGVVALYAELNERADFLQRASELKSRFLSNMSHEFRTPLNSIMGLSQILLDRLDGSLSPEQEKQVRFIHSSAHGLTELVNDLLDLAKVEAGKVTIRPSTFQVSSLFAALRGMLRPLLSQNSSVSLVFDEPVDIPEMYSDEAKVSQILRNFISNALKFTDRGEIRVSVERGHGNTVVFSVADTGIGIRPEDQDSIFQEWTQVEGKLQKMVKGTGLGLPLSRKFAQLLGGEVYVRSQVGLGSTFFAAIPANFNGEIEPIYIPDTGSQEIDSRKIAILVVEDSREERFIYERYFQGTPFQAIATKNLKEARAALRDFRPAAIILDVLLEGEHSWELLRELKQNPATANIPVLVVTIVDNRAKALSMGADAFHSKPVDRNWLLEQLQPLATPAENRLLLIDDDTVSRYLVKTLLNHTDFRILEASGGIEGLRKASDERPAIVILDLAMPDMSGFEVLLKLKDDPRTASIPVIVHTSKILEAHEKQLLHDAVAIISKESQSRELLLDQFAAAFKDAGFPNSVRLLKEAQHG
jgi:signal transduction histidine kinase/CheY-like chemotaxis protein